MVGTNRHSPQGLELGYIVNPNYWSNGYATWGLTEFLRIFWRMERMFFEKSHIPHLVAKYYSRRIDERKKSDAYCWYFDRPRSSSDETGSMVKDGKQEFSHA
ncbi:91207d38-a386-4709-ad1e-598eb93c817a-CDS [Sclerotinia trifoliorum]|uniref:91207d38-a386-4709-ad1e-598eb93c817a-CDS n=1 Tax=Sclerotinia trifoliorum TaxID=28548 RepID=A0A8H2VUM2_9HELO|nr:91207d38-a386-4709-ad1e-598eb93c817a-CDS [Sclerotinia trifoliorum]